MLEKKKEEPSYEILTGDQKATMLIPDHDLITITDRQKSGFVFFSVKADYEQKASLPAYTNITAEASIAFMKGSLEKALAYHQNYHIDGGSQYKNTKKIEEQGYAIWLMRSGNKKMYHHRVFMFIPAGDHVFIVDALTHNVQGMPSRSRKTINEIMKEALQSIEFNGEALDLKQLLNHIRVRGA